MLNELVGKNMVYSLMGHAASELAFACAEEKSEEIQSAFSKVCAYGMDLNLPPSTEAVQTVIEEVINKIEPQKSCKRNIQEGIKQ